MEMKDELKLLLFDIIYDKLGLSVIEKEMEENEIKPKEIDNPSEIPLKSNYFFLKNDVTFDRLTSEEIKELNSYYDDYKLNKQGSKEKLINFLDKNMLKLLLKNTDQEIVYWGPLTEDYMTSSDCIALAMHYIEFDNEKPMSDDQADFLYERMNYIQDVLGPKGNIKAAILMYNEAVDLDAIDLRQVR